MFDIEHEQKLNFSLLVALFISIAPTAKCAEVARIIVEKLRGNNHILLKAVESGNQEIEKIIADPKTDLNYQNIEKNTALILASFNFTDKQKIAKLLITDNRTNPNHRNRYGNTAIMIACSKFGSQKVAETLVAHPRIELDHQDNHFGKTALMKAISCDRTELAKKIVIAGANIGLKDSFSKTALDHATYKNNKELIQLLQRVQTTRDALKKECSIPYKIASIIVSY